MASEFDQQPQVLLNRKPPGTFLGAPAGAATNPNTGWRHFTVIVSTVALIDWLFLSANGHQRALLAREGDTWIARWVAP